MKLTKGNYIWRRIQQQAHNFSNKDAVICDEASISYIELVNKASQLADKLADKGVKKGDIVGVYSGRNINFIIALLGLIKMGVTYLPIDLNYPDKRVNYIIENSNINVLLVDGGTERENNRENIRCTMIDICDLSGGNSATQSVKVNLDDYAIYLIYTSGSTGNPKGALVSAEGFNNLLDWNCTEFGFDFNDKTLVFSSVSFDLAQKNLFSVLMVGGTLVLYPNISLDYEKLLDIIEKEQVTNFNCTPSMLYPILSLDERNDFEKLISLRYIFLGGEPIQFNNLLEWQRKTNYKCKVVNEYGPTECTDVTLFYEIDFSQTTKNVPLGKPINNAEVLIIDEKKKWAKEGELYISGKGLGMGYINNLDLTNDKFVKVDGMESKIYYRTGDYVKQIDDLIYFVGRKDNQIKHKGYRIELLEIERTFDSYVEISKCVINYNREQELIEMFYSTDDKKPIDNSLLMKFGKDNLPFYMLPNRYIFLEQLPINENGKINRIALNEYRFVETSIKLNDDVDQVLVKVCQNVMKQGTIDLLSNLLALGCDSLDIIRIVCKMEEYGYGVSPVLFYQKGNLLEIIPHIQKIEMQNGCIVDFPLKHYNCSYYQRKYVNDFYNNKMLVLGNSIAGVEIPDVIDVNSFTKKINAYLSENIIYQLGLVNDKNTFEFEVKEEVACKILYSKYGFDEKNIRDEVDNLFMYRFDLYKPPFFVVKLIENDKIRKTHILVLTNSIFFDKASVEILVKDILKICGGENETDLRKKRNGFLNLLRKENELTVAGDNSWSEFWNSKIMNSNNYIHYEKNSCRVTNGKSFSCVINKEYSEVIRLFCRSRSITVNIFFLALYFKMINLLKGDILI